MRGFLFPGALVTLSCVAFLAGQFEEWKPVSRGSAIAWSLFYFLFIVYAALNRDGFLILDYANLMIHEAGHVFFSWFGHTITILGGTLGELVVPPLCGLYFFWQREATAVAFCSFWFFENFLYIGTYMADARAAALPLVGSGEHDWEVLFTQWNVLLHDQQIGGFTRMLGWVGMLSTVMRLVWRQRQGTSADSGT